MIFRQLFDSVSGTYTYLLASRRQGEALIMIRYWRRSELTSSSSKSLTSSW